MDIFMEYYLNLLKSKKSEVTYDRDGNHDRIIIDFDSEVLCVENIEYYPSLVLFYECEKDDYDCVSKKGNPIYEGYTFTNEGFGEGLYFNKTINSIIFEECMKLINSSKRRV